MGRFISHWELQLRWDFYALLAVSVLTVPLGWAISWIAAATVHELGHITAIRLLGCPIEAISVGWHGARIVTGNLDNKEWICALAGPLCGLLPILFARCFPAFALCGFVQTAFNLLPVYPMDGGRALFCLLRNFCEESQARMITFWVAAGTITGCALLAFYLNRKFSVGLAPFLIIGVLAIKTLAIKFPCKDGGYAVQ